MERWVAEAMARRYREMAADFRRYPKLETLVDKAEQHARDVLALAASRLRREAEELEAKAR